MQGSNLTDVSMHSYGLTFGQQETGPVVLKRLRGVRRPGTSRLSAGGFVALTMEGGSVALTDSELSNNLDDLTDIQSYLCLCPGIDRHHDPFATALEGGICRVTFLSEDASVFSTLLCSPARMLQNL